MLFKIQFASFSFPAHFRPSVFEIASASVVKWYDDDHIARESFTAPKYREGECPYNPSPLRYASSAVRTRSTISYTPSDASRRVTEAYGTYHDIFESLFSKSLPPPSNESTQNVKELIIESYNVVSNHYPSLDALQRADFLLISGSAASAYLPEPWIITLVSFVRDLPQVMPGLRIVGICFGHQIVGIAFGGTVQKNELGWEIGVRSLVLTNWGKRIWGGEKLASPSLCPFTFLARVLI